VQLVDSFPDQCGEWQEVDSFPDFTIQVVDTFGNIRVEFVDAFPGAPGGDDDPSAGLSVVFLRRKINSCADKSSGKFAPPGI